MKFRKQVIRLLVILVVTYFLFGGILYFAQDSMLYYPSNQSFENCAGFSGYEKIDYNKTRFYYKKGSTKDVFVYYHGNAGSACGRSGIKDVFEETGDSLIFVEYTGYSGDDKKPSGDLILENVRDIVEFVEQNNFDKVTAYGQSIGSCAASFHASISNVNDLILTTPFSSLKDVVQSKYSIYPVSILLKNNFDNIKRLENFDGNLFIIHGDNDHVIPHKFSQKLFNEVLFENKEYVLIEGAGHNDIWNFSEFNNKLNEFLNRASIQ